MIGVEHFESQTPHFFKIVLSDALKNGRLGIPKKFMRKYGSDLSDLVFLQVASGDVWEVELLRGIDGAFLRRGWPDFVKHYHIEQGDFLVFRHEGGSAFRVVIFDTSALEIKYPLKSEKDDPRVEEDEGDTSLEACEDHSDQLRQELPSSTLLSPSSKRKKRKTNERLNKQAVEGARARLKIEGGHQLTDKVKIEVEGSIIEADSCMPTNPFFVRSLRAYEKYRMNLPAGFVRKARLGTRCRAVIVDPLGRKWSVGLRHFRNLTGMYRWSSVVRANGLATGDTLMFDLLRGKGNVMEMKIMSRAGRNGARPSSLQKG